jgi:hypothetical protein
LAGGTDDLELERDYLRRVVPRAVVRNLGLALHGRGSAHAIRAGVLVIGVLAAIAGGLVEIGNGWLTRVRRRGRAGLVADGRARPAIHDATPPGQVPADSVLPEGLLPEVVPSVGPPSALDLAVTGLAVANAAPAPAFPAEPGSGLR